MVDVTDEHVSTALNGDDLKGGYPRHLDEDSRPGLSPARVYGGTPSSIDDHSVPPYTFTDK